jgi:hypothetical protein
VSNFYEYESVQVMMRSQGANPIYSDAHSNSLPRRNDLPNIHGKKNQEESNVLNDENVLNLINQNTTLGGFIFFQSFGGLFHLIRIGLTGLLIKLTGC